MPMLLLALAITLLILLLRGRFSPTKPCRRCAAAGCRRCNGTGHRMRLAARLAHRSR